MSLVDFWNLDTILIGLLGAMLLVQSIWVAVVVLLLGNRIHRIESSGKKLSKPGNRFLTGAEEALDRLQPIVRDLPVWADRVSKAASGLVLVARSMDSLSGQGIDLMRNSVTQIAQGSDATITAISRVNYRVHRAIISPAYRLSRSLSVIQSRVSRLILGGNRQEGRPGDTDQQIFI